MRLLLTGGTINPLSEYYGKALSSLGHEYSILYPGEARPELSGFDGLLLTGGADIHPGRFGRALLTGGLERLDLARDELEFPLFAAFFERRKPIWGICRGMQVINVALGGTLVQDLPSQRGLTHSAPDGAPPLFHEAVWEDGRRDTVNSFHHQAVDAAGIGLCVCARAGDGVPEAVRHVSMPVFAVQWHPERMDGAMSMLFNPV